MQVDIIFDPVCPWCFIGKRRLERAMAMRPHISVERRWRPFLLNPDLPGEGIDRTAYLLKKFGSEARVRRVYGAIAEAGQSGGDRFRLRPYRTDAEYGKRASAFCFTLGTSIRPMKWSRRCFKAISSRAKTSVVTMY